MVVIFIYIKYHKEDVFKDIESRGYAIIEYINNSNIIAKDANGYIYGLCIEDMFENFGVGQTETKARNSAIRAYLKRNGYLEEGEENGK